MADLTYYAAKIAECLRLLESSNDPLYRDVYRAMADEFAEKHAALQPRAADVPARAEPHLPATSALPASPLLSWIAPPSVSVAGQAPAQDARAGRADRTAMPPRSSTAPAR